jgi:hypothetical protein
MSDKMSPAEILAEQGAIEEMRQRLLAMPGAGDEGTESPRSRFAIEIFERAAALQQRMQPAPAAATLENIEARLQSRQRLASVRTAVTAEMAAAPEGSPAVQRSIADLEAIAAAEMAADPKPDPAMLGWDTYDRALGEWSDTEREQFKLIFRALGLSVGDAVRLGSAWAAGPDDQETDFRKVWADRFEENDALFRETISGRLPRGIVDKLMRDGLKRRPAFVAEALKIARARAGQR